MDTINAATPPRVPFAPAGQGPPARLIGLAALVFSVLYFVSDLLELANGGFTRPQLVLTYVAEAAIPLFVLGLYAVQRPRIGTLGCSGRSATPTRTSSSPAPCCWPW